MVELRNDLTLWSQCNPFCSLSEWRQTCPTTESGEGLNKNAPAPFRNRNLATLACTGSLRTII